MGFINKVYHKGITVFSLLFISFLTIVFPLTAHGLADLVQVTLRVDQVFTKNSSVSGLNGVFPYELTSLEESNPLPSGSVNGTYTFTIEETESKEIGPITFITPGVYQYEIKMKTPPAAIGYTYDTQVYTVGVYVKRSAGNLIADVTVQKNGGSKVDGIKFETIYTPLETKPETMVDPPVKKTVSGSPLLKTTFTFLLTAKDIENPMPEGSADGVKKITILGSGEGEFGTWKYTREGTYYYTISEEIVSDSEYDYDQSVYTITDTVKEADNQLAVIRTVTNSSGKQVESCTFINKYKGQNTGTAVPGGKGTKPGKSGVDGTSNIEDGKLPMIPLGGGGESSIAKESGVSEESTVANENSPGISSPKTGDDSKYELYTAMLWSGIIAAASCIIYLILAGRREKRRNS